MVSTQETEFLDATLPSFNHSRSTFSSTPSEDFSDFSDTTCQTEDLLSTINTHNIVSPFRPGCSVLVRGLCGELEKARFEKYTGSGLLTCHVFRTNTTQNFNANEVKKDRGVARIRHNGYVFEQVHNDPATGTVTVRNLNHQPFGRTKSSPFLLNIPASEVKLLNIEMPITAGGGGISGCGLDDVELHSTNRSLQSESDSSINTDKLMDWGSVAENKVPKRGALVLIQQRLKGDNKKRWFPATFLSEGPEGLQCRIIGSGKEVYKTPFDVKLHKIRSKQLLRHKGYLFRVVKVENDQSLDCQYIVQNLNKKPFGRSGNAPSLMSIPLSEVSF